MLGTFTKKFSEWNRRRHIAGLRRSFADCGFPVDHLEDAKLEAAMRRVQGPGGTAALSPKSIYFALRRLAPEGKRFSRYRPAKH